MLDSTSLENFGLWQNIFAHVVSKMKLPAPIFVMMRIYQSSGRLSREMIKKFGMLKNYITARFWVFNRSMTSLSRS